MPRSVIQTSPGFAAGILNLLVVHRLKHRVGRFVQKLQFVLIFEFTKAAADCGPLVGSQFREFGNDFANAHVENVTSLSRARQDVDSRPDEWFAREDRTLPGDVSCFC